MEQVLISELFSRMFSNEAPSTVILCGVCIYILKMGIQSKRDISRLQRDVDHMSKSLNIMVKHMGLDNVIELPSNNKSNK